SPFPLTGTAPSSAQRREHRRTERMKVNPVRLTVADARQEFLATYAGTVAPRTYAKAKRLMKAELDAFEHGPWGAKFPSVVAAWRRAWDKVIPFFALSWHQ
ncbi:MAG: hypothetical protein ACXWCN_18320, partial [Caldimonas sp.]